MKTTIPTSDFFDLDRFIQDVRNYRLRQGLSHIEMGELGGIHASHVRAVIHYKRVLTLPIACILAEVCDLSLDSYRKPRSQWTKTPSESDSSNSTTSSVGRILPWEKPAPDVRERLGLTS